MSVDLSKVRAGDKVLLRDGSKIMVDDRGGSMKPLVLTHYLTVWSNNGKWSAQHENCPFDIVGVIYGKRTGIEGKS
jgi:hypothetical protein